jgi:arylsulfatase A-like enzyme
VEWALKVIGLLVSGLRRDHLSVYGNRWLRMEHFERLGRSGRVFTEARCARADAFAVRMELLTGLDSRRLANAGDFLKNYSQTLTLPAQLTQKGFQTALLTDNYAMLPVYDRLGVFETIHFVPGQGADHHLPEGFASAVDAGNPKNKNILTGTESELSEKEIARFLRNENNSQEIGHPTQRLFESADRFLKQLDEKSDWLILIDAFGLTPPWNAPAEFTKYRTREDSNKIAWPVAGEIDPEDTTAGKQINFFRRAYADQCLFIDAQLGKVESTILSIINSNDNLFFFLSDHGLMIGDENCLLSNSEWEFEAVTKQAILLAGCGIKAGSETAVETSAVDLFTTIINFAKVDKPPLSDGKIIDLS